MKRLLPLLLAVSALLCGCGNKPMEYTHFAMNTVMQLTLWGPDSADAQDKIVTKINELESLWSATDPDSALYQRNMDPSFPLEPAQEALLNRMEELSRWTGGAFDPKMGRVSQVWGFYNEEHRVPSPEEIQEAMAHPRWDLGGALKGYAGDECIRLLEEMDMDRALLNLGGNILTYGEKPDGTPWQIGIQNPAGGDYLGILSVTGTASVVTSGDYQRYFELDGIRYHHILDPETGCPADSGLRSVTVVCSDGLTADVLSTALFVMGLEEAAEFWRDNRNFEAVFLTEAGTLYATEGILLSGCEYEVIGG